MTLRVKNWEKFQHYKNRRPPWIRLYRDLLIDPDFEDLPGELVKTLIKLWLAASEVSTDGTLPDIRRLSLITNIASNVLALHLSKLNQWVEEIDSNVLATCKQHASDVLASETETETESETETDKTTRKRVNGYTLEFENFRKLYPGHRLGGKRQDWKSWVVAKRAGMASEHAIEHLVYWKACPLWKKNGGSFIVAISKWLRDGYWETIPSDYESGKQTQHEDTMNYLADEWRKAKDDELKNGSN